MQAPKDKDSVLALYKEGPVLLERTLKGIKQEELDISPEKGGWTIRQIVHHIVDGDDIWKLCIKIALGNEQAEFNLEWYRAFPQTTWADHWAYSHRSIDVSLTLIKAIRSHVMQLLEQVPDGWNRSIGFCEPSGKIERVPVGAIVKIQADHVVHHIKQIEAIRR